MVADSVVKAVNVLSEAGGECKILAGGQGLVPMLNFRLVRPTVLVDINRIPNLTFIEETSNAMKVGALTRHFQLETICMLRPTIGGILLVCLRVGLSVRHGNA